MPTLLVLFLLIIHVQLGAKCGVAAVMNKYLGKTVTAIKFISEDPIDETKLSQLVPLTQGQILQQEKVRDSIEVLYATRLFEYIEVDAEETTSGVVVTFRLRPNFFFADFRLGGDPVLRSRLSSMVSLPVGEVYSRKVVQDILVKVQQNLKDSGYYQSEVLPNIQFLSPLRLVNVEYLIKAGPRAVLSALTISGKPLLETQELLARMRSKPGKFFSSAQLKRDFDRLRKFYVGRGFLNTAIRPERMEYVPEDNAVKLELYIDAGPYVFMELSGAKIREKKLRDLIPIYEEGSIDVDLIEEGKKNIEDYLERRGFFDVSVRHELIEAPQDNAYQIIYTVDRGQKQKVVSVEFPGATQLDERELLNSLKTRTGGLTSRGTFSRELIAQDVENIKDYYLRRGFEQVKVNSEVTVDRNGGRIAIRFLIQEGPQTTVAAMTILGNLKVQTSDLLRGLNLTIGKPFSQTALEEDRRAIEAKYLEQGYTDVRVEAQTQTREKNAREITFQVKEGEATRVGDILIAGNNLTKRKVITRNITIHEGFPLSQDSLLASQQKLYRLGLFDKVDVVPVNVNPINSFKPVIIRVEDASPIIVGYGVGYQDRERVRGTVEISHNNLFGLARSISFRTRASFREQRAQITYKEPRLFNRNLDSFLTLFYEKAQRTGFDTIRRNASLQVLKQVHQRDNVFFRYNFETVDLSDVAVNPQAVGLGGKNLGTLKLSTLSTAWIRDTRDDPFDPTSGFFNTASFSVTSKLIGSETNFATFFGQSQAHRKVASGVVLVSSLRLGLTKPFGSTPEVPISERFFAGGSTTLRGFSLDRAGPLDPVNVDPNTKEPLPLGGNALFIGNFEARFPVTQNLTFAPFYDTGNVFSTISTMRLSSFTNTLGFGFRYKTPFGPLRIDVGFNTAHAPGLPGHKIFFTVGNPF